MIRNEFDPELRNTFGEMQVPVLLSLAGGIQVRFPEFQGDGVVPPETAPIGLNLPVPRSRRDGPPPPRLHDIPENKHPVPELSNTWEAKCHTWDLRNGTGKYKKFEKQIQ